MWDRVIELLQRAILAVTIYSSERLNNWYKEKKEAFDKWWGVVGADEDPTEEMDRYLAKMDSAFFTDESRLHPEIREEIRELQQQGGLVGWLGPLVVKWQIGIGAIKSFVAGIQALRTQDVNEDLKPSLAPIDALLRAEMLNPQSQRYIDAIIKKWGLPESSLLVMRSAMKRLPQVNELLTLVNRKEISEAEAIRYMQREGFSQSDAELVMQLRFYYPSPSEWASLAGREAYESDQIAAFELDKGFDALDPKHYEKAGLTEEVARQYWVAHWSNVSPQQLFEMIQRKAHKPDGSIFTLDDVDSYVRLADINPFFGEALSEIAFRPYTRVDLRRMVEVGVLEPDDLPLAFEDLGYDPEKASNMATYTARLAARSERNLTKTQFVNMYELRQISRLQLAEYLQYIGYTESQAETISYLEQAKREDDRVRSFIRRGEYEYKRGMSSREEVNSFLVNEDLEPDQIGELFDEWDNEMIYEQALPSKDDLLGWYATDSDEQAFRQGMRALRYTNENIDKYISEDRALLSKTDLLRLLDQGAIDEQRAHDGLLALGYTEEDSTALIQPVLNRIERRKQRDE